eukprot:6152415-Prymnesium_polylepis.1
MVVCVRRARDGGVRAARGEAVGRGAHETEGRDGNVDGGFEAFDDKLFAQLATRGPGRRRLALVAQRDDVATHLGARARRRRRREGRMGVGWGALGTGGGAGPATGSGQAGGECGGGHLPIKWRGRVAARWARGTCHWKSETCTSVTMHSIASAHAFESGSGSCDACTFNRGSEASSKHTHTWNWCSCRKCSPRNVCSGPFALSISSTNFRRACSMNRSCGRRAAVVHGSGLSTRHQGLVWRGGRRARWRVRCCGGRGPLASARWSATARAHSTLVSCCAPNSSSLLHATSTSALRNGPPVVAGTTDAAVATAQASRARSEGTASGRRGSSRERPALKACFVAAPAFASACSTSTASESQSELRAGASV